MSDGRGGGIKPALLQMLVWCSRSSPAKFTFVFLAPRELKPEIAAFAKQSDSILDPPIPGPRTAAINECDVVYCPFGITDYACPGIPTVTLVVDVLHREFPETLTPEEQLYREKCFGKAIARSDALQVISDSVHASLVEHYPSAFDRVFRTYLTTSLFSRKPSVTLSARPYFLYPANGWAHKNHETLLVAYAIYRSRHQESAWRLVLAGHLRGEETRLITACESLGVRAYVEFTGFIPETHLAKLWAEASALVFPSLHEGFGLPLIEAMSHGVPIVASDASAIPEIVGKAGLLVSARSPDSFAAALLQIATSEELRSELIARGYKEINRFSSDIEYGRLAETFTRVAAEAARWRRDGYYDVDGLTNPEAAFGLPPAKQLMRLHYLIAPLGVPRTLKISCGAVWERTISVSAHQPTEGTVDLPPRSRTLIMSIPDASSLHPTDPRVHGVVLRRLTLNFDDEVLDLLSAS
jgi:glycosyltransferase involved in cell wall biosynthesis